MSTPSTNIAIDKSSTPKRDWFGYIFTTVIGIVATIAVAWYQLYATQRDAAAAELEKARAVRQVAVAIVEEHALNGKKLEVDRLARLIEQRRRDELISIPIPVTEVVELAEFSISSSRHLSVERKEEMKPIFDAFYSEQRARAFQPSNGQIPSSSLLNDIAKKIQDGKPSEALAALKRLDELQKSDLAEAIKKTRPSVMEAISDVVSSPSKMGMIFAFMIVYFWAVVRIRKKIARSRFMGKF